jgi:hypothetical protein
VNDPDDDNDGIPDLQDDDDDGDGVTDREVERFHTLGRDSCALIVVMDVAII